MPETTEVWLPVVGYEGLYAVSDAGNVRSLARVNICGRPVRERVLKPRRHPDGHLRVTLCRGGVQKTFLVHRLVATAFLPDPGPNEECCHGDGDPSNNAVSNLRWDSRSENHRDCVRHGTHNHARKTHCPRGHPLAGNNLVPSKITRGRRLCLACDRASGWFRRRPKPDLSTFQAVADDYFERLEQNHTERTERS